MRPRPVLAGVVLLIGAAVALVIFATRTERAVRGGATSEVAVPLPETAEPELSAPALPGEEPDDAMPEGPSPAQRTAAPDERPTISGRVVVAGGFPSDEGVRLTAEVYSGPVNRRGNRQELSAPIAADGSFALRVPVGTRYALLDVEGGYLYLAEAVRALPGEKGVVLEPEVLAVVRGRVLPPLGVPTSDVTWSDVELGLSVPSAERPSVKRTEDALKGRPEDDGSFEYVGVQTGVELQLRAKNPFGPDCVQRIEPLEPGERREILVALDLGITISGRVVDEEGRPVSGVHVRSHIDGGSRWSRMSWSSDDVQTDADGAFELTRLERRTWVVTAHGSDLAQGGEVHVDGTAGDAHGLILPVVVGGCIEGTVVWSDGRPVEDFNVSAHGEDGGESTSGESGRFRLCGLMPGSYQVEARAVQDGVEGKAMVSDVQVGDADVRLVLEEAPVFELPGLVVDGEGHPVPDAEISATRVREYRSASASGHADGSFVLRNLSAGEWNVRVRAPGHQSAEQLAVAGARSAPLRFELGPVGFVSGEVVDSRGRPVEGADVGDRGVVFRAQNGMVEGDGSTGSDGRFRLEAPSRRMRIQAAKQGHAPSEVLELDVAPGETVDGIVLHLRDQCRLEGRVLDEEGEPVAGASVFLPVEGVWDSNGETDARGSFVLEGLPPGPIEVWTIRDWNGERAMAEVDLVPGAANSVELRFEKGDPVTVRGKITLDGRPVECLVFFIARTFTTQADVGPDGAYEVTLRRPGACQVVVMIGEGWDQAAGDVRRLQLSIPDVDEHVLDLAVESLQRVSLDELGY